jgi:molybdenum cofactor cytidylyltransferase
VIAAIVLAAGHARRFGAPKLLQDLAGKPVLRWSAELFARPPIAETVVVVPPPHDAMTRVLAGLPLRLVVNPAPDQGMASSIACGVDALGPDVRAVLIGLGDEPRLGAHVVDGVIARYQAGGASIVAPRFRGVPGHPVLFDRTVFAELRALTGDVGARAVVERDAARVAILELDEPRAVDVDMPADLERLRSSS